MIFSKAAVLLNFPPHLMRRAKSMLMTTLVAMLALTVSSCSMQGPGKATEPQTAVPALLGDTKLVAETTVLIVEKTALDLRANEGLFYYDEKPFSGKAITYHEGGDQLAVQTSFLHGKKHGLHQKWFVNGALGYQANYESGRKEGAVKSWWSNGNLRSLGNFEKGVAQGVQQEWYKTGAAFKERNLVDGKEAGMQKAWRANGKIYNNYEAKDGRTFGLRRAKLCFELQDEAIVVD